MSWRLPPGAGSRGRSFDRGAQIEDAAHLQALVEHKRGTRVVEFLAGEGAAFVTGENIVVDGGLLAGGARLDDRIGGNPAARSLAGVNRGSIGERHSVRRL